MNEINLVKLDNTISTRKKINNTNMQFKQKEDSFISSKEKYKSEFIDNATTMFSRDDFDEQIKPLKQLQLYSDGLNGIGHTISADGKLLNVTISKFDPDVGKIKTLELNINEYIDFITLLTAKQIEKNPENEANYKKDYIELLNIIKTNKAEDS